ncbi:4-nitrophenyl phosphatase [Carnobacterium iners]|uniref:4-nitrophenyl phosphatase n=1 Tax=Carnobacterium iners TaxID=1073423 RepID=A0A1X7MNX6_9LACT|nr:TIGR01457 family HAD-type hydrolase [Carnobacterium iners]SEK76924.1 4-nitrophenyl phosphatase [Carnobacterium iners]SMH26395.1 4-nitrophenyl phosphatase [Carnobacterium iners]
MDYKGYLIDLDGTMYNGTEPILAAPRFIKRLQDKQVPFLFVTNNTTKTQEEVMDNLQTNFGITVTEDHIYTGSLATAKYMKKLNKGNKVFAIGETGLKDALTKAGFIEDKKNPDFVVVALDREATYTDFETATLAIQKGAQFIATNKDTNMPSEKGMVPGAGSLVALVVAATRVEPTFIGKPESIIMGEALEAIGLKKEEVVMVGDNYETDILAGIQNDIDTLLVYTGFTKPEDLTLDMKKPTHSIHSLDEWTIR